MCKGGCTGSTPCDDCDLSHPSLNVALISNNLNVKDVVPDAYITADDYKMEAHNFINTYYLNKSGHFDHASINANIPHFHVNGRPLSLVHEIKKAYREKTGTEVSMHDSIKLQQELRNITKLKDVVGSHVSMTRSDISMQLSHIGVVKKMKAIITAVVHSTTLNTSVSVDIPHLLTTPTLTLYGKIKIIQRNIRAAINPVFSKLSKATQDLIGLNLAVVGDLEFLKSDIEGSTLEADLKASLLSKLPTITLLKNGFGLPVNTAYQPDTYQLIDEVNAFIQTAPSLNGMLGLSLGDQHLACITNELLSLLHKAGMCKFQLENILVVVGASIPSITSGRADTPTGSTDQENAAYGSTGGTVAGMAICATGATLAAQPEFYELCPEAGTAGGLLGGLIGANMNNIVSGASDPNTYLNTTVAVYTAPPEVPQPVTSVCNSISSCFSGCCDCC
jgi:hypothetical protein